MTFLRELLVVSVMKSHTSFSGASDTDFHMFLSLCRISCHSVPVGPYRRRPVQPDLAERVKRIAGSKGVQVRPLREIQLLSKWIVSTNEAICQQSLRPSEQGDATQRSLHPSLQRRLA